MTDPTALAAQDAAEALIVLGWPVVPVGDELEAWSLGCLIWSDEELIAFALRRGVHVVGGVQ